MCLVRQPNGLCRYMAMVCVAMALDTRMLRSSQVRVGSGQLPVARLPRAVAMSAVEPRPARLKDNLTIGCRCHEPEQRRHHSGPWLSFVLEQMRHISRFATRSRHLAFFVWSSSSIFENLRARPHVRPRRADSRLTAAPLVHSADINAGAASPHRATKPV